jgi:hypothetical protein
VAWSSPIWIDIYEKTQESEEVASPKKKKKK